MKKLILSLLLILSTFSVFAKKQHYKPYSAKTHGLAIWARGGYSNFLATLDDTQPLGCAGGEFGLGFEMGSTTTGFILQTGVGMSVLSSTLRLKTDLTEDRQMYDTEGAQHTAHFLFHNTREIDTYVNMHYVLLLGRHFENGSYFLLGPKVGYALSGNGKTTTEVIRQSRYDGIIGGDGDGLLSDMPNHFMDTVQRKHEHGINKNLHLALSFECGYAFKMPREVIMEDVKSQAAYRSLKLAAFVEFGGYINTKLSNSSVVIVNKATQPGAYEPAIGNLLYRDKTFLPTLFCGVKLTYVIQYQKIVCATCDKAFEVF